MPRKTIHVPLTLPQDSHGPATFIHTVEQRLTKRPGVYGVRVTTKKDTDQKRAADVELDYDPDLLSMAQINSCIQQAGGSVDESIGRLVLPISGMLTPQNQHTVQAMLNKLPGVTASVSFTSQTLRLEFDRSQCALPEIVRCLDRTGLRLGVDRAGFGSELPTRIRRWPKLPNWLSTIVSQPDLALAIVGGIWSGGGSPCARIWWSIMATPGVADH